MTIVADDVFYIYYLLEICKVYVKMLKVIF